MLDDRKLDVLRAIVEDFVSTNEPVGSKALVERHRLGVSPATVRNDMASLEEEGYIAQPHTSAGRVPTDKGYRLFVDRLSAVKPLSPAERRAIDVFLTGAVDLDDIIRRTVRLLAQLTRQVAVVQYPVLDRSRVRHVELVTLNATRLMLVVITDTGRVEQRIVETPGSIDDDSVADLRARLNARLAGRLIGDAAEEVQEVVEATPAESRPVAAAVVASVLETLVERHDERIVLAGTPNLQRLAPDFAGSIGGVLEALEENVILIRLLGETTDTGAVRVRIGEENPHEGLWGAAVVSTGYGTDDRALGGMGVLGPMRMDYPGTMGAVRAVARYVGRILAEN